MCFSGPEACTAEVRSSSDNAPAPGFIFNTRGEQISHPANWRCWNRQLWHPALGKSGAGQSGGDSSSLYHNIHHPSAYKYWIKKQHFCLFFTMPLHSKNTSWTNKLQEVLIKKKKDWSIFETSQGLMITDPVVSVMICWRGDKVGVRHFCALRGHRRSRCWGVHTLHPAKHRRDCQRRSRGRPWKVAAHVSWGVQVMRSETKDLGMF